MLFHKLVTHRDLTSGHTLIVAPHADDEMIGCGGRKAATDVRGGFVNQSRTDQSDFFSDLS